MRQFLSLLLLCALLLLTGCGRQAGPAPQATSASAPADDGEAEGEEPFLLDLTRMSSTVVYAQVFSMVNDPAPFVGQMVRMRGPFYYYEVPSKGLQYFTVLIRDATACCAQGIEFVWAGEHQYPEDYPPLDTELTVTGRFETYEYNGYTLFHLVDAEVTWDEA